MQEVVCQETASGREPGGERVLGLGPGRPPRGGNGPVQGTGCQTVLRSIFVRE